MGRAVARRILFALGASPERLRWGIETARLARAAAGLDPDTLDYGAYVNVVCHPDRALARALARGGLSTFARFSVMHGDVVGPADEEQRRVFQQLHDSYDMRSHTRADSEQARTLTDDFVDAYAVVGPAGHCLDRLAELSELGLTKLVAIGAGLGTDSDAATEAHHRFVTEVLPHRG